MYFRSYYHPVAAHLLVPPPVGVYHPPIAHVNPLTVDDKAVVRTIAMICTPISIVVQLWAVSSHGLVARRAHAGARRRLLQSG